MPATPVSLLVTPGEWVNLYSATGISPGAVLLLDNLGDSPVYLSTADTQPEPDTKAYQVLVPRGLPMKNEGGSIAEWVYSPNQTGRLSVRMA